MAIEPPVAAVRFAGLSALMFALTACSGGSGGGLAADGGISGTGNSIGAIQAFGSIFVNGTEFGTSRATIVIDGSSATQNELQIGQIITVSANFDDNEASRVEYRAQIKGPVQALSIQDVALGTATLTVLGQAVATNAETNLVGTRLDPTAANALQTGDLLEVSGLLDASGTLVATFIEAHPTLPEFAVTGRVANLTATTFDIGGLTIDYSATNATPVAGELVEAKAAAADFNATTSTLTASLVESLAVPQLPAGTPLEIEGYITRFAGAGDFDVSGGAARATANTTFEGGSAADLGLDVKIEVEGRIDSSGVLVAEEIKIESTGSIRIEGDVEQLNASQQTLTVLGVTIAIRPQTDLRDQSSAEIDPFTFADIVVGDRIEMRGFLDGSAIVASQLDREDTRPEARLRGRVTAKNAGASQIDILGTTVTGDAATQYQGAANQTAFFSTTQVGDFVDAQWSDFTSTDVPADELALVND
jgi:Domain of unknown function (DUF5666)